MTLQQLLPLALGRSLSSRRRRELERELQSHLEESRRNLQLAGMREEDAERQSLLRLGDRREIEEAFLRVYRPRRPFRLALAFGLAGSLLAGAYSSGAFASSTRLRAQHPPPAVHRTHVATHRRMHRSL